MEEKIKSLFNAISEEKKKFVETCELFGNGHDIVRTALYKIIGLENAFEIIAGESYTDYLLSGKYI